MRIGDEGSFRPGDIRWVKAGHAYGPEEAGEEGVQFHLFSLGGDIGLNWADLYDVPGALTARLGNGESLACGGVLMATGRRPWLADLGLDAAGVANENGRITVDANSCTPVPHLPALGDVTDRVNLTPVAIDEGRAFADSVFGSRQRQVNHNLVASAVFSDPELATVGLSEEQAIERHGVDGVVVHRARFRSMARALPASGPRCLLKLVVEKATDRVLGCHMVGEHAAEIIQMAAIAVGMGATKADFDRTMALHPSVSEEFVTMQ